MASLLTTVASKQCALKERAAFQQKVDTAVDKLVKVHVDGEVEVSRSCFPKFVSCPGLGASRFRRMAVPTVESAPTSAIASSKTAATGTIRQRGDLMTRLVGRSKKAPNESVRIETAMKTVQERVDLLHDKVQISRERALAARRAQRHDEALRELKRSKATEKQLATAKGALEALERQEDMLAQSTLQQELAAALSTTNKAVKKKQKGLLNFTEKAVDEAVELNDDTEDIGAVFDGLLGSTDATVDDESLLEELNSMLNNEAATPRTHTNETGPEAGCSSSSVYAAFPTAPKSKLVPASPAGVEQGRLAQAT